jgi:hypothetical protein
MPKNNTDDLEALLETSQESQAEEEIDPTAWAAGDPSNSLADERPEHNPKREQLQAEEASEGPETTRHQKAAPRAARLTPLEQLLASEFDERQIGWRTPTSSAEADDSLLEHLKAAKQDFNADMAWKEDLRLLGLHHFVPGPYTDSWTKEANLFFRRLVIIKRRLEMYKKQKRA